MYLFRNHRIDSAGPGKFRGGSGFEVAYMAHNTNELYIGQLSSGDKVNSAQGIWGGYPGGGNQTMFLSDGEEMTRLLKDSNIPSNLEELAQIQGVKNMPSYFGANVTEGATAAGINSGGGGYGDPLERDPKKVRLDVMNYIHSFEMAQNVYGVILDKKTCEIDFDATEKQRRKIIKKRLATGRKEL
jgi:N-methylhydantoinase B/oxoprolinase/acetone carboxylase alpha subunit